MIFINMSYKFKLIIIILIFQSINNVVSQVPNCDSLKNRVRFKINDLDSVNLFDQLNRIDSIIEKDSSCLTNFEKGKIYIEISDKLYYDFKNLKLIEKYIFKGISNNVNHSSILVTPAAIFIKKSSLDKYLDLIKANNSSVIEKNKDSENIDKQLMFVLRYMEMIDQEIRFKIQEEEKREESVKLDSLYRRLELIDQVNENLLGSIFETYMTYPGVSLVGTEQSTALLIFHHSGLDFRFRYFNLVQNAVNNGELYADLSFLIDKTLYEKYKVTLYGTHYSGQSKETDPQIIDKYRKLLGIN